MSVILASELFKKFTFLVCRALKNHVIVHAEDKVNKPVLGFSEFFHPNHKIFCCPFAHCMMTAVVVNTSCPSSLLSIHSLADSSEKCHAMSSAAMNAMTLTGQ